MSTLHTEDHYRKNWSKYLNMSQMNMEQMLSDEIESLKQLNIKASGLEAMRKMKTSVVYHLALSDVIKRKAIIMNGEMTGKRLPEGFKALYEFDCLQLHDFKVKYQQGTR